MDAVAGFAVIRGGLFAESKELRCRFFSAVRSRLTATCLLAIKSFWKKWSGLRVFIVIDDVKY